MIFTGLSQSEKIQIVNDAAQGKDIVWLSTQAYVETCPVESFVDWAESIMYRTFYPLLQRINRDTVLVIDEFLRTQNRNELTYNCVRHYCNQAGKVIVFQYLPMIDSKQDFMILFDFVTRSRWKREPFTPALLAETEIHIQNPNIEIDIHPVEASAKLREKYSTQREKLFHSIGNKDPHTIPRNLHLLGGSERLTALEFSDLANTHKPVSRNARLKTDTFKSINRENQWAIVDLPHRSIDFTDFLFAIGQTSIPVFTTDLKVDQWYASRLKDWQKRLDECYTEISGG